VAASWWFDVPARTQVLLTFAFAAAISEAVAPRASDNLAIPGAVLATAYLWG
jgi:hypothetical protein